MGAILAGTLKAPITAVLMVFELTRNYAVILPLMTACLASTLVSQLLVRSSIFTAPLHRRGVHVPLALTPLWIRQPKIESLLEPDVITVKAAEPFSAVVDRFLHSPLEHDRLYVVDDHRGYLGVISLHEIKLFLREAENLDSVIAADVLNSSFPYALVTQPVSRAIELLAESNAERLPVLEDAQTRRLLGSVSKRDLLAIYREGHVARAPKNPD
jgi:CIC family chloride channel protein